MNDNLANTSCIPCKGNTQLASEQEKKTWMLQLIKWQIQPINNVEQLVKTYKFKNFRQSLAFTEKIGELAEQNGHHPAILTEWGKTTVHWWTHAAKGLHKNDFVMAAKTDDIYKTEEISTA